MIQSGLLMTEIRNFIIDEIRKSGKRAIVKPHEIVICCPFHQDTNPSLGIVLEDKKKKYPPGTFNCWSCSTSGSWNKLAEKLGLNPISQKVILERDPFYDLSDSLELGVINEQQALPKGLLPWEGKWRGLPQKFLAHVNAKKFWDNKFSAYRIVFPVYNYGELRGYIAARTSKAIPKRAKYMNASGPWAKTSWFGLDYPSNSKKIKKIYDRYFGSICLVEGPNDALTCLYHGIPALALMGTKNWGEIKSSLLVGAGFKKVVLFLDGDSSGREATRKINVALRKHFKVKIYRLPDDLDPGNCGKEHLDKLKLLL